MEAKKFFSEEEIESNFEKLPVGDTYINKSSLDVTKVEKEFSGVKKTRYNLVFLNKDEESKEFEVGNSIINGIKKAMENETKYIRITRQGTLKEDTTYTVTAVNK